MFNEFYISNSIYRMARNLISPRLLRCAKYKVANESISPHNLKMTNPTLHNPDRFMSDLRQVISQGKKRIGIFLGAGAPVSLLVDDKGKLDQNGKSLIPDVKGLTEAVCNDMTLADKAVIDLLLPELGPTPNIEVILTRIRRLSEAIGAASVHGLNGTGYNDLAGRICDKIGSIVAAELPDGSNPYTEIVSWIAGTSRRHSIEIFTPNYDLLLEEAFERARLPYFDGFTGSHRPFFDPASITNDELPARWSKLWKIHGSLGWEAVDNTIIRNGSREAAQLIYPDHLKYNQISRQPFSALFERLKEFLLTPDSILICSGFSFMDSHISSVIEEALCANSHTAVLAFQYGNLKDEPHAVELAKRLPNLSVYAKDGAVISGANGNWQPGQAPFKEWDNIRKTFWKVEEGGSYFTLGDFAQLSKFFALAHSQAFRNVSVQALKKSIEEDGVTDIEKDSGSIEKGDGDAAS